MNLHLDLEDKRSEEDRKMEMSGSKWAKREKWNFEQESSVELERVSATTVRGVLTLLFQSVDQDRFSQIVPLGHGDPSLFPSFRTPSTAEDAVVDAIRSAKFNSYSVANGILPARRAVAKYLSPGLPHELTADDVYLTVGCIQAIEVMVRALTRPGANILLPRPGFPYYESAAACFNLEVRHFDLLPDRGWEVDLAGVEALSDENTVAMVVVNPGNPTGSVYTRTHLETVALTARKLGLLLISDEVYERLTFGDHPFVAMGVFGSIAPVVTLGSISKRWCVPGWRLGWIVVNDPDGIIAKSGLPRRIMDCLSISPNPATLLQGALADILEKTKEDHFGRTLALLKQTANTCYAKIAEIPCFTCPNRPQGSMFAMVKLHVSMLDDISDDMDFCLKLAKEESVILLPGIAVGMTNWLRITFAVEPSMLQDGLGRIKAFCQRHSKNK